MATSDSDGPSNAEISERLDQLSAQMELISGELRLQRESREKWVELNETLVPVTRGAMDMATAELEVLSEEVTIEDATRFARTLAVSLPQLQALLAQVGPLSDLVHDLTSLSGVAMEKLTEVLQVAEEKGYFGFAQQTAFIADRIVTQYSEDDIHALGENVVTIMDAVKEMTQPEVMGLVQRTALTVHESELEHDKPPSLFAIMKSMRDPETRRGLARVMAMLRSVGDDQVDGMDGAASSTGRANTRGKN